MLFFVPIDNGPTYGPLDFFFNFRSKYEVYNDYNFDSGADDEYTAWNNRFRVGFNYDTGQDDTNLRVTYQFTHTSEDDNGNTYDFDGRDLVEAFLERTWDGGGIRFGRQKVSIGSGRLVGTNEWSDTGRFWNGLSYQDNEWSGFVGRLDVSGFDMGVGEHHIGNIGYDWGSAGETNVIYHWSHWGNPSIYTVDHVYRYDGGSTQVTFEGAYQWGREGGQDLEAWAGSVKAKFAVSDRFSLFAGYDTASGGESNGTNNTFNDLFPNDHRSLGLMDMQAWRNVNAFHVGAGFKISDKASIKVAYYDFKLNDSDDGWYNASNGSSYGYGDNGYDDVGNEIDISLRLMLQDNLKLGAGFAIFSPGDFIADHAGSSDNQTWFYGSLGYKF